MTALFDQVFAKAQGDARYQQGHCMDCGEVVEIDPVCIAAAFTFWAHLKREGKAPLHDEATEKLQDKIARCPACSQAWQDEQRTRSLKRCDRARDLFQAMRELVRDGAPSWDVDRFDEDLPAWFRQEHGHAYHGWRVAVEKAGSNQDRKGRGDAPF